MLSKPARNAITFIHYDLGFSTMRPADCGGLCFDRRKVNLSQASAGQQVGVRQVTDRIWFVSFMDCDLGYFDDERRWLLGLDSNQQPSG
jgi:putative transposase